MKVAIDFDGVVVAMGPYDATTPLRFLPGAYAGLHALRRAGHTLLLYSGRANRARRENPALDPLCRGPAIGEAMRRWRKTAALEEARYQQMLAFVAAELPGVFAAIDDGTQGKPAFDLLIDDRAVRFGVGDKGLTWPAIRARWGEEPVTTATQKGRAKL